MTPSIPSKFSNDSNLGLEDAVVYLLKIINYTRLAIFCINANTKNPGNAAVPVTV